MLSALLCVLFLTRAEGNVAENTMKTHHVPLSLGDQHTATRSERGLLHLVRQSAIGVQHDGRARVVECVGQARASHGSSHGKELSLRPCLCRGGEQALRD